MNRIITATAVALMMGTAASAQNVANTNQETSPSTAQPAQVQQQGLSGQIDDSLHASRLIGLDIRADNTGIGKVKDIIFGRDGSVTSILVAIPLDRIEFTKKGDINVGASLTLKQAATTDSADTDKPEESSESAALTTGEPSSEVQSRTTEASPTEQSADRSSADATQDESDGGTAKSEDKATGSNSDINEEDASGLKPGSGFAYNEDNGTFVPLAEKNKSDDGADRTAAISTGTQDGQAKSTGSTNALAQSTTASDSGADSSGSQVDAQAPTGDAENQQEQASGSAFPANDENEELKAQSAFQLKDQQDEQTANPAYEQPAASSVLPEQSDGDSTAASTDSSTGQDTAASATDQASTDMQEASDTKPTTEEAAASAEGSQPPVDGPVTPETSNSAENAPAVSDPALLTNVPRPSDTDAVDQPEERYAVTRDGFTVIDDNRLGQWDIAGAPVYDRNNEHVGEVDHLLTAGDGTTARAVLDVGGFLGLGEHTVAVDLKNIAILREDASGDIRVYVDFTEEELEDQPEFEG